MRLMRERTGRAAHDRVLRERDQLQREHEHLQRERKRLRREIERLKRQLDEARRAANRQAAPFAKELTPHPRRRARRLWTIRRNEITTPKSEIASSGFPGNDASMPPRRRSYSSV